MVEEDSLLRALSPQEAAPQTGRNLAAVYGRCRELGLPDAQAGKKIRRGRESRSVP